jgi:hypothetical protein
MQTILNFHSKMLRLAAAAIALSSLTSTAYAQEKTWTVGRFITTPDSIESTRQNRGITVHQTLPVGDRMTAFFTYDTNKRIINANGSAPYIAGTVAPTKSGIEFFVPGLMNGKKITDIDQEHTDKNLRNGTISIGAFQSSGTERISQPTGISNAQEAVLEDWLIQNGYTGENELSMPDFTSGEDIYYGVDLATWAPAGIAISSLSLGQTFDVVNGFAAALPGYYFSTGALTVGPSGWTSDSALTGTVTYDSFHSVSETPEPATIFMLISGLGMIFFTNKKRT